jgi:hypothetical protein
MNKCNRAVDLNCDGVIESWERADDFPRLVFGVVSLWFTASAMYIIFYENWMGRYTFNAYTW